MWCNAKENINKNHLFDISFVLNVITHIDIVLFFLSSISIIIFIQTNTVPIGFPKGF